MKKKLIVCLTDRDSKEAYGSLDEIFQILNRVNLLKKHETYLSNNKVRKLDVLGTRYLFYFRDGNLHYRIDHPSFDYYLKKLSLTRPDVVNQGFQFFRLKVSDGWQTINLNTINFFENVYHLTLIIRY